MKETVFSSHFFDSKPIWNTFGTSLKWNKRTRHLYVEAFSAHNYIIWSLCFFFSLLLFLVIVCGRMLKVLIFSPPPTAQCFDSQLYRVGEGGRPVWLLPEGRMETRRLHDSRGGEYTSLVLSSRGLQSDRHTSCVCSPQVLKLSPSC